MTFSKIKISLCLAIILPLAHLFPQAPDTLWTRTYGGNADDMVWDGRPTSDGGFIIVGGSSSFGPYGIWIVKTNSLGDTEWTKIYRGAIPRAVDETSDGGYVITGGTDSINNDICLIKIDALGDTIWTKTYGGIDYEEGYDVKQTKDGGFIILGFKVFLNSHSGGDLWLIKTDELGDTTWTKLYWRDNYYTEAAESVIQTPDGGFMIVGTREGIGNSVWLLKTNNLGDTLWTKNYRGGYGNCVRQTSDGGYIIGGNTYLNGAGQDDIWLIKTNANGDTLWTRTFGGSEREYWAFLNITEDHGNIIAGFTESFGSGGRDIYLIRTSSSGEMIWTKTLGGPNEDLGITCHQTPDGGYAIIGVTESFGAGDKDFWLIKLAPDLMNIEPNNTKQKIDDFKLFQNHPNPFNSSTTIKFSLSKTCKVTLNIFNVLGEEVATLISQNLPVGSYSYNWNALDFPSGVYFYRLNLGNYIETKKMILLK